MSNDPVGFSIVDPMTFSRYAYGWNNPYSNVDPKGESSCNVLGGACSDIYVGPVNERRSHGRLDDFEGYKVSAGINVVGLGLALLLGNALFNESADDGGSEEKSVGRNGGGKNAKHANQKRRDAAAKKYEEVKSEYESLSTLPNKTPEIKKAISKAKKAMEKAKRDKDFTGEHHSAKAKK